MTNKLILADLGLLMDSKSAFSGIIILLMFDFDMNFLKRFIFIFGNNTIAWLKKTL